MKVIGIGDNVCDVYLNLHTMFPGGQAMNFSVYAGMLGAEAAYMGVFGDDAVAAHVKNTLDEMHIDRSHCRTYAGENGCAKIKLVEGDRVFVGSNRGGVAKEHPLRLTQEDLAYIAGFGLVHTSNNGHFDEMLAKTKTTGVPLSYDLSGRWNQEELLEKVLPYADFLFMSCGNMPRAEVETLLQSLLQHGVACMAVATLGAKGSLAYDGKTFYENTPVPVKALDTLGAGDSFTTAFLLHLMQSAPQAADVHAWAKNGFTAQQVQDAMQAGARLAAKTCMTHGAFGHGAETDICE